MQLRIWAAIVGASLAFGSAGVAARAAFDEGLDPYTLAALRAVIAAVTVVAILRIVGRRIPRSRSLARIGAVLGISNFAVPFVLGTLALQHASAGFVGLIIALIPLTTSLFAHLMLEDEPLTLTKLVGLLIALAGVIFLVVSGDSGLAEGGEPILATALGLATVASIGFGGVFARRHAEEYEELEISGLQFGFGAILLIAVMLIVKGLPGDITVIGWSLVFYTAIASTVIAFLLFFWLVRNSSATTASLVGYVVPLVAIGGGILLLDEQLQPGLAIGGVLILAGVIISERAQRRAVPV